MRKLCSVALTAAFIIICMPLAVFAADISVTVKGTPVEFTDSKPYVNSDNRTLVPLRAIAEALDLNVKWDDATKSATFTNKEGTKKAIFTIGEYKYIFVDGDISRSIEMDTAAVITDNRTYAPARYLAEAFGYNVSWDGSNSIVSIIPSNLENKVDGEYKDVASFIPEGWKVLEPYIGESGIAEGDLNNDGIMDKAFVIEENDLSESEYSPKRNLIILFGNTDNSYKLAIRAQNAILLANEGGTFGDPFEGIEIDRGSVLLNFMGGSVRWNKSFRFRYQDNGWYLIGFTEGSYELVGDSMECLQDDYNLITGDYIGNKLVDGEIKTIKNNIGKKPLLNLNDFVADEYYLQS